DACMAIRVIDVRPPATDAHRANHQSITQNIRCRVDAVSYQSLRRTEIARQNLDHRQRQVDGRSHDGSTLLVLKIDLRLLVRGRRMDMGLRHDAVNNGKTAV